MIVPRGQVPSEKFSRVVHPINGCGIARASYPDDKVVELNFDHDKLVSEITSVRMTTFCNTARGGKDEIVTSSFVLVGNYLYPACVADMVLRARIGTHEASP